MIVIVSSFCRIVSKPTLPCRSCPRCIVWLCRISCYPLHLCLADTLQIAFLLHKSVFVLPCFLGRYSIVSLYLIFPPSYVFFWIVAAGFIYCASLPLRAQLTTHLRLPSLASFLSSRCHCLRLRTCGTCAPELCCLASVPLCPNYSCLHCLLSSPLSRTFLLFIPLVTYDSCLFCYVALSSSALFASSRHSRPPSLPATSLVS